MTTRDTSAQVVHRMRQVIRAVLDPEPGKEQSRALWAHFEAACAACGRQLVRRTRWGRLALADPAGPRAIGNRLLLCEPCQNARARGEDWRSFLQRRCGDDHAACAARTAQVERWLHAHPARPMPASPEISACLAQLEATITAFPAGVAALRAARDATRRGAKRWQSAPPKGNPVVVGNRPNTPGGSPRNGLGAALRALQSRMRARAASATSPQAERPLPPRAQQPPPSPAPCEEAHTVAVDGTFTRPEERPLPACTGDSACIEPCGTTQRAGQDA
jgi:hypothetical protein